MSACCAKSATGARRGVSWAMVAALGPVFALAGCCPAGRTVLAHDYEDERFATDVIVARADPSTGALDRGSCESICREGNGDHVLGCRYHGGVPMRRTVPSTPAEPGVAYDGVTCRYHAAERCQPFHP